MTDRYRQLGKRITAWYLENKRDLPWRNSKDPYRIWVSEIMLQQTRVDTVMDYYNRFLERFPDVYTLARASLEDVLAIWQGLGYYSRARNLHRAACTIVRQYDGKFPEDYRSMRQLPGIGDYTAGAVLSIAFGQPHAAVDGNVLRVTARMEGLKEDIAEAKTKNTVSGMVQRMIPKGAAGDFTQAMMELGALVCVPGEPICSRCPVQDMCVAKSSGRQRELPVKKKKDKPLGEVCYKVAVVCHQGHILLEYRDKETLLSKMWGLPMVEQDLEEDYYKKYGFKIREETYIGEVTHVFTHRIWRMKAVRCEIEIPDSLRQNLHWVREENLAGLAVPTAFKKVLRLPSFFI